MCCHSSSGYVVSRGSCHCYPSHLCHLLQSSCNYMFGDVCVRLCPIGQRCSIVADPTHVTEPEVAPMVGRGFFNKCHCCLVGMAQGSEL